MNQTVKRIIGAMVATIMVCALVPASPVHAEEHPSDGAQNPSQHETMSLQAYEGQVGQSGLPEWAQDPDFQETAPLLAQGELPAQFDLRERGVVTPVIEKRRSAHGHEHAAEHLGGGDRIGGVWEEMGHRSGMVVVLEVYGIPTVFRSGFLAGGKHPLQIGELPVAGFVPDFRACRKDHRQLSGGYSITHPASREPSTTRFREPALAC